EKYWRELREKTIQTRELPYQQEVYHEGTQASWDTLMTEGFEGAFPSGLWSVKGNPTWGADDYKPHSGSMSAWCARSGSSGLDPSTKNYPNNMDARMIYGPFDLSDAIDAELLFYYWLQTESCCDRLAFYASKNGISWYGYSQGGHSAGWLSGNFDLTSVPTLGNLCGESEVWIMLRFYSDSSVTYKGAFVDDIILQKDVPTGPPPSISDVSPGKASAGTGTTVTIQGANFGATQNSSKVEFFYKLGQPKISAPIVSWSDTAIVCEVPTAIVNQYPASASSGPVTVTTTEGGISNDYSFRVTFGYGGRHWPGSNPRVDYYVNENASDCTGEGAAVIAAAKEISTAGSRFTFRYAGATSATGDSKNGMNEIVWAPISTPGVIGYARYWVDSTDNTHLEECDIVFNDNFDWGHGASPSYFDVQTTAAHELGHWLNLRDLYGNVDDENDSAKTMYGFGSRDLVKHSLHNDDISGILWIYGDREKPKAMPWIPLLLLDD
ncbi:MAG: IPT/TIG domain-containing protein, partial [Anaerolineales bacterium]